MDNFINWIKEKKFNRLMQLSQLRRSYAIEMKVKYQETEESTYRDNYMFVRNTPPDKMEKELKKHFKTKGCSCNGSLKLEV